MRTIFNSTHVRFHPLTLHLQRDLAFMVAGLECLDLRHLTIVRFLQAVTLLYEVGAQGMAVLQLAVESGAGVFRQITGRLRLGDTHFSGSQAGFPGCTF